MKFEPDWIVAIGGGSPIDAAKAMWVKYEYPEITFEEMCKVFGMPDAAPESTFLRHLLHFRYRYRSDRFLRHHRLSARASSIRWLTLRSLPDVAIVDPALAETMPQKLVAHTGMDAMTHAIEAYVSTANCDYTDPLALHAIKMIQQRSD